MGTYKFIPHTADEQFIVESPSLEDAFATSVSAFYEIMLGKEQVGRVVTKEITIDAPRLRTLLYDFLNELIFCYDDQDLLLQHVDELEINENNGILRLRATLRGDTKGKYDIRTEIKSMTYSDMVIQTKENGTTSLSVVVDI